MIKCIFIFLMGLFSTYFISSFLTDELFPLLFIVSYYGTIITYELKKIREVIEIGWDGGMDCDVEI